MEQLASLGQEPADNTAGKLFKKGEALILQNARDKEDPEFEEFSSRDLGGTFPRPTPELP